MFKLVLWFLQELSVLFFFHCAIIFRFHLPREQMRGEEDVLAQLSCFVYLPRTAKMKWGIMKSLVCWLACHRLAAAGHNLCWPAVTWIISQYKSDLSDNTSPPPSHFKCSTRAKNSLPFFLILQLYLCSIRSAQAARCVLLWACQEVQVPGLLI